MLLWSYVADGTYVDNYSFAHPISYDSVTISVASDRLRTFEMGSTSAVSSFLNIAIDTPPKSGWLNVGMHYTLW